MNARIYSLLLTLCPADLQREFGAEMVLVFLDDLADQRRRFGFRGAARVWRRSLTDLCGAALGEAIAERQFLAPLAVYSLQQIFFGIGFLWRTGSLPAPAQLILSNPLLSPGWIPAAVAYLAVRAVHRSAPIVLKLERP